MTWTDGVYLIKLFGANLIALFVSMRKDFVLRYKSIFLLKFFCTNTYNYLQNTQTKLLVIIFKCQA